MSSFDVYLEFLGHVVGPYVTFSEQTATPFSVVTVPHSLVTLLTAFLRAGIVSKVFSVGKLSPPHYSSSVTHLVIFLLHCTKQETLWKHTGLGSRLGVHHFHNSGFIESLSAR